MPSAKKILVLAGFDQSLINFRGELLRALVHQGHEVLAAAPSQTAGVAEKLAAMGVRFVPVDIERTGTNPLADWKTRRGLRMMFACERPDMVLAYTIKPVVYGIPAAYGAGVPERYALITGLGAAFHSPGWKGRLLAMLASRFYRKAFRHCSKVMVQNQDIAALFARTGVSPIEKLVVMPGSGVDIVHYQAAQFPRTAPRFLLVARLLRDKGIREYVAAARKVRKAVPEAEFWIVGDVDPNPAGIPLVEVQAWHASGDIHYKGPQADVRPFLAACTAYVLPSYHEGMPRSVLEALATGRAVVTTDTPGCRDTVLGHRRAETSSTGVTPGENGFLVPVKSVDGLVEAMLTLARDPALAEAMGRRGRVFAENNFDVRRVNAMMLATMGLTIPTVAELRSHPV